MSDPETVGIHNMDVLFERLSKIDVPRIIAENTEPWWSQTLCEVNDCVVRLGIIHGEFHWHKHDEEDEFFFVLQGQLHIDVEGDDGAVLDVHQGYTVPRGIVHRTRAPEPVVVLMIEKASVVPTGDG